MKKLLIVMAMSVFSVMAFAADFQNIEQIADTFWAKGQCIKLKRSEDSLVYFAKKDISYLKIKDVSVTFHVPVGRDFEEMRFTSEDYTLSNDSNGNIVLKSKN